MLLIVFASLIADDVLNDVVCLERVHLSEPFVFPCVDTMQCLDHEVLAHSINYLFMFLVLVATFEDHKLLGSDDCEKSDKSDEQGH